MEKKTALEKETTGERTMRDVVYDEFVRKATRHETMIHPYYLCTGCCPRSPQVSTQHSPLDTYMRLVVAIGQSSRRSETRPVRAPPSESLSHFFLFPLIFILCSRRRFSNQKGAIRFVPKYIPQLRRFSPLLRSFLRPTPPSPERARGTEGMGNLKAALGTHELTDKRAGLWRALVAEFLGTMLLNFFGCGTVVTGNVVAISLAFGLAVAAAIQSIGHVSGGHVNPAVTLGLLVIGKLPILRAVLYVSVQSAGAIAGSAILRALSPESMESSLGLVSLAKGVTPVQGFGVEFILALVLVFVVCGACDPAKPYSKPLAPLVIGLAVTLGHLVGVPRTGSGMNPARSLGSSVVMGAFENHWLYWVGPILGGMAGGLVYEHATGPAKHSDSQSYDAVATDDKELERAPPGGGGRIGNSP